MAHFNTDFVYAYGAYGRNATREDWVAGKDFRLAQGPYFSIRDVKAMKDEGISYINFTDSKTGYTAFFVELE